MGFVLIIVLRDMFEMKSIIPFAFLNNKKGYFLFKFGNNRNLIFRL